MLQIPLSCKVHGVNAIGAEVESHAPLRHAGRVSRITIRRMQSTWCQTPGEHVSDETAHTPSLSQRGPGSAPALRLTLCCGVERRAQLLLTERSVPGAWTRGRRSHRESGCVCGTWDFAHPGARRLTLKNHPATILGGGKLNGQSKVLPCVFAESRLSTTSQRLWPGAHWTVAVQGSWDSI